MKAVAVIFTLLLATLSLVAGELSAEYSGSCNNLRAEYIVSATPAPAKVKVVKKKKSTNLFGFMGSNDEVKIIMVNSPQEINNYKSKYKLVFAKAVGHSVKRSYIEDIAHKHHAQTVLIRKASSTRYIYFFTGK